MTAKDLFLHDKELATWWASVVHDEKFAKALLYCQNAYMQIKPSSEQINAVIVFTDIILTISDNPDTNFDLSQINPGLHHNFETATKPED